MLRNFLITSLRILWRNKLVSAINILSLSIGITAFILILLYVHHETSYDKFNENYDRIYRLEGDEFSKLPKIVGDHLRGKIPEIECIAQLQYYKVFNFFNINQNDPNLSKVVQLPIVRADSSFFKVFTIPFIQGNPKTALNEPFTIVLSESTAKKLFGNEDPMGKMITLENNLRSDNEYRVNGIIQNVDKSHVKIDALISISTAEKLYPDEYLYGKGQRYSNGTYLLLQKGAEVHRVEEKINSLLSEINDGSLMAIEFNRFQLQALKNLYLNSTATMQVFGEHGNGKMLIPFVAVAFLILALAIINYINLTTARSTLRLKEVILKKVMGSGKSLLRVQFILESTQFTFISFLIALTIIQLVIPIFNQLAGVNVSLTDYNTTTYWFILIISMVLISLVSGLYPSLILTSFKSVVNTQSGSLSGTRGAKLRTTLLTFQMSISMILIIGLFTNFRQLHFVKNSNLGFSKEQVILISHPLGFENVISYRKTLKNSLMQYQQIKNIAFSNRRLGIDEPGHFEPVIDGERKYFQYSSMDPDYLDVMGIEMVEGRNFSWDRISESHFYTEGKLHVVINEKAAQQYWDKSPVGQILIAEGARQDIQFEIIGVCKDFHYRSMHHKVEPMMFSWRPYSQNMLIKVSPKNMQSTIKTIENEWKKVYGSEPFAYSFLDEAYDQQYKSDERAATIIAYFTILAITIACMGLFALSSFMAVRRTKEIGIRKALGRFIKNHLCDAFKGIH
jgi:putative ABC transport system permease protein